MANISVISMEELPRSLETKLETLFHLPIDCKIQWAKRVSFRYHINKYSTFAFVFVDLIDFTRHTSRNITPYLWECSPMTESRPQPWSSLPLQNKCSVFQSSEYDFSDLNPNSLLILLHLDSCTYKFVLICRNYLNTSGQGNMVCWHEFQGKVSQFRIRIGISWKGKETLCTYR